MSAAEFTKTLYSNSLVWAPAGDEAFDDGSYVLRFDVGDRVRLIAVKRPDSQVDPASVREVWISADIFYNALQWRDTFMPNGTRFRNTDENMHLSSTRLA